MWVTNPAGITPPGNTPSAQSNFNANTNQLTASNYDAAGDQLYSKLGPHPPAGLHIFLFPELVDASGRIFPPSAVRTSMESGSRGAILFGLACVRLVTASKTLLALCGIGFLTALTVRWFCIALDPASTGYLVYESTVTRMDSLLAGAFCAFAVRDANLLRKVQGVVPFALFISITGLFLIAVRVREIWSSGYYTLVFGYSLFAIAFACFVLSAYLSSSTNSFFDRTLRIRPLTKFGKYSYGIYVYQTFVQYVAIHFLHRYEWYGRSVKYALLISLCWLAVPFAIAYLSYHLFEKHFLRLKNRFRASPSYPQLAY